MKGVRILALAAAAVIAVNSSVNAAGRVWFEATSSSTNGSVLSPAGAPTLELVMDVSQGLRADWVITVLYQTDGGAGGWGLDVGTLATEDVGKFNIKNIQLANTALASILSTPSINNGNGLLITDAGGGNLTPGGAPAGIYTLMTFTLSKNKLPGELNTSLIYAGIGGAEFGGNDDGPYEVVQIGPNAPVVGYNPGPWGYGYGNPQALPVIVVRNIPEPATFGLIGLGALVMLRRRK